MTHGRKKDGKREPESGEERPVEDLFLELPVEIDATRERRRAEPPRAAGRGRFVARVARRGRDH